MGNIHPHLRDVSEFTHKLWDHLHYMADFKLDIDSPYPLPEKNVYIRPERLKYPQQDIRYRHFGKVIEKMIQLAIDEKDEEKKLEFIRIIVRQMSKTYALGSREGINDETIFSAIENLSEGRLVIDDKVKEYLQTNNTNNFQQNQNNGRAKKRKNIRKSK